MTLRAIGDDTFARLSPYAGQGLRNHSLRLYDFALLHIEHMDIEASTDFLYAAAMLHDLGLALPPSPGADYLRRTLDLAREVFADEDVDDALLEECMLYNHSVRAPAGLSATAEAFRRAVWTEHTHGRRRYGLPRARVRQVFRDRPFDNFPRVLADFFWRTAVFEPQTIPGIFFP